MSDLRVLIVDDEPAARHRLALMLDELDVEVAGEAPNGVEALRLAEECRPDLILLDIEMPEVDGFDVARRLPRPGPSVVFQTAYDEHALRAFEHAAVDYLVKPVTLALLQRALERVEARRTPAPGASSMLTPELLGSLRAALAPLPRRPRVLVRSGAGHRLLRLAEVIRFVADGEVVFAVTAEGRAMTDYTLRELAEQRTGEGFVRISRSELVNLEHVQRFSGAGDAALALDLSDGSRVRVARRRAGAVRERLRQLG